MGTIALLLIAFLMYWVLIRENRFIWMVPALDFGDGDSYGDKMLKKLSIFSMVAMVALAGCAQMPQYNDNQVTKNHQELKTLSQKQKQLSLATLAISMNLNHVQHVISRRIENNQPLIAAPQKDEVIKSVVVTMGNGETSPIGSCNPESITVKAGDTLSGIATATNTTVNELEAWNGLHSGNIDTGEALITSQCPGSH